MDLGDLLVAVFAVVAALVLRRRLSRVEAIVLRLQGQVTDLRFPHEGDTAAAVSVIDIEPFVD